MVARRLLSLELLLGLPEEEAVVVISWGFGGSGGGMGAGLLTVLPSPWLEPSEEEMVDEHSDATVRLDSGRSEKKSIIDKWPQKGKLLM